MRGNKLLKMSIEFHLGRDTIKDPSVLADREMLFSDFLQQQIKMILKSLQQEAITVEVFSADFQRLAVLDRKKLFLFIKDDTIENIKKGGVRKLKFSFVKGISAEVCLEDAKMILNIIEIHEALAKASYDT